jgi:hypothetical protein
VTSVEVFEWPYKMSAMVLPGEARQREARWHHPVALRAARQLDHSTVLLTDASSVLQGLTCR